MTAGNRTARANRLGVAAVGLALLAGGLAALGQSVGAFTSGSANDRLLTVSERRFAADHGWFWFAVAAGAVVVALLCVRWLAGQFRRSGPVLHLEADRSSGDTRVGTDVVAAAVEAEVGGYVDVHDVRATIGGSCSAPELSLVVRTAALGDLDGLRRRIDLEALPHLRAALEVDRVPVFLRLVFDAASPARTVE